MILSHFICILSHLVWFYSISLHFEWNLSSPLPHFWQNMSLVTFCSLLSHFTILSHFTCMLSHFVWFYHISHAFCHILYDFVCILIHFHAFACIFMHFAYPCYTVYTQCSRGRQSIPLAHCVYTVCNAFSWFSCICMHFHGVFMDFQVFSCVFM